ncbi:hypothetical protein [Fusobacterium sp. PH5-44]|uniref:hypothetical protein n=1 Tax=unclassified Fusobacterium TaxID=2648384 RepID=UPI003D25C63A
MIRKYERKPKYFCKILVFLIMATCINAKGYYNQVIINGDSKYKEFYLTEDIYENSKENFSDIRILNSKDEEIPYVIEEYQTKYDMEISDSFEGKVEEIIAKKETKEITLRFVKNVDNIEILGNQLIINSSKNFLTKYKLLGSYDNREWYNITSGELYKTDNKENLTIDFENKSKLSYTYYKLEMPLSSELVINSAKLNLVESFLINTNEKESLLNFSNINSELNANNTSTFIKIKTKALPLKNIRLFAASGEFKREYEIYSSVKLVDNISSSSRNDSQDKRIVYGHLLGRGSIYRIGTKENLVISDLYTNREEEIVIKINNKSDKPINISGVQGVYYPARLIFTCNDNKETYRIIYGAEEFKTKPSYDISNYYKSLEKIDKVQLEDKKEYVRAIIESSKEPTKGYDQLFYKLFIGLFSIMLIVYIAKSLSKKKD